MAGHKWVGWKPETLKVKDDKTMTYEMVAVRTWRCSCGAELHCYLGADPGTCPSLDPPKVPAVRT